MGVRGTAPARVQLPSGQPSSAAAQVRAKGAHRATHRALGLGVEGTETVPPSTSPGEGLYCAEDDREFTRRLRNDGEFWKEGKQESTGVQAQGY